MSGSARRFRDALTAIVPPWLSDRSKLGPTTGNVGWRFLWVLVAALDDALEFLFQGLMSWLPGLGTPTALAQIGRTRGLRRGRVETDDAYAARLRGWLDRHPLAGSQLGLAQAVRDYIGGATRVRVVSRSGLWTTIRTDGTVVTATATWDWDSATNPERAGFWSELFVIIYPTPYAHTPGTLGDGEKFGDDGLGFGHAAPIDENDALRAEIAQWKAAHSFVRTVIFTTDSTLFDPATPSTCPDGHWGQWSEGTAASHRNIATCRYWDFEEPA